MRVTGSDISLIAINKNPASIFMKEAIIIKGIYWLDVLNNDSGKENIGNFL